MAEIRKQVSALRKEVKSLQKETFYHLASDKYDAFKNQIVLLQGKCTSLMELIKKVPKYASYKGWSTLYSTLEHFQAIFDERESTRAKMSLFMKPALSAIIKEDSTMLNLIPLNKIEEIVDLISVLEKKKEFFLEKTISGLLDQVK